MNAVHGPGAQNPNALDDPEEFSRTARSRMSCHKQKLIDAATSLRNEPPQIDNADFMHAVLCQVGMPRKKVAGQEFRRKSGEAELIIQAGYVQKLGKLVPASVPYGPRPRLVLIHVSTQAVRHKTRSIEVGNSVRQFMLSLGLDTNGSQYGAFRTQMEALAACRLILGGTYGSQDRTLNVQPFDRYEAWLSQEGSQGAIWPGVLELSEPFYDGLREFAVPLAHEALVALKGSSLALDTYTWLAHRLCRVKRPTKISWGNLRNQFGQEYKYVKYFKREMRLALRHALTVYHAAKVEDTVGGIILLPSPPPIPKTLVTVGGK